MSSVLTLIEREIQRLAAEMRGLAPEGIRALPARWTYHRVALSWQVVLSPEVLEPDLDVEILSRGVIVRGQTSAGSERMVGAVLPVPRYFDVDTAEIHVEEGVLEIRAPRRRRGQ